jgi:hypothetical protein
MMALALKETIDKQAHAAPHRRDFFIASSVNPFVCYCQPALFVWPVHEDYTCQGLFTKR